MTTQTEAATKPRKRRLRGFVAALLVFLCCVSLLGAVIGVWARRSFLNTERFVDKVESVIDDPAVQEAVSKELTRQAMVLIDPAERIEDVLPVGGDVLAGLLASSLEGFVEDRVQELIASDGFEELFLRVVSRAHALALRVLEGDAAVLEASVSTGPDGQVTLNLIPLINEVLKRISEASPEIFGHEIDIPEVSVEELPAQAITRLEDLLGVDLADDFGQVPVYDHDKLETVQDGLQLFNQLAVGLVIATLVFAAAALGVSHRRRRTSLQLIVGSALTLVLLRRVLFRVAEDIGEVPKVEVNKHAAQAIVEHFIDSLLTATAWMLIGLLVAGLVVLVTGPYNWAVALRQGVTGGGDDGAGAPATGWIGGHRELAQLGVAAIGVIALVVFDLSWLGVLILLVIVGAIELVIQRAAGEPPDADDHVDHDDEVDVRTPSGSA